MRNIYLTVFFILFAIDVFPQDNFFDPFTIYDTLKFESEYPYINVDTSENNIWQTGVPAKMYFDSAYSLKRAILTDSINPYPANNHSFFDLCIGEFNYASYWYNIFIEFKHKFDTDTLKDGGYITVSYDMGKSWLNIIEDQPYGQYDGMTPKHVNKNLYSEDNLLFNNEKGFSGRSNGWISTGFAWFVLPVKNTVVSVSDTMIIRFNFISDSINTNKEGWIIDNICLYTGDIGGGVLNSGLSEQIKVYPNPLKTDASIDLGDRYQYIDMEIIDSGGKIVSRLQYKETSKIDLDCRQLSSGAYYLNMNLNKRFFVSKKILVE